MTRVRQSIHFISKLKAKLELYGAVFRSIYENCIHDTNNPGKNANHFLVFEHALYCWYDLSISQQLHSTYSWIQVTQVELYRVRKPIPGCYRSYDLIGIRIAVRITCTSFPWSLSLSISDLILSTHRFRSELSMKGRNWEHQKILLSIVMRPHRYHGTISNSILHQEKDRTIPSPGTAVP